MDNIAVIGKLNPLIHYIDRPTVKVVIKKEDKILILNEGLLPGGGISPGESKLYAIARELREELGVSVSNIEAVGSVVQYRNFLEKRYVIYGYVATLDSTGKATDPQDDGEVNFISRWLPIEEALKCTEDSIKSVNLKPVENDTHQGKLYNLMTTRELLKKISVDAQ